jgi:hypothetical protein
MPVACKVLKGIFWFNYLSCSFSAQGILALVATAMIYDALMPGSQIISTKQILFSFLSCVMRFNFIMDNQISIL